MYTPFFILFIIRLIFLINRMNGIECGKIIVLGFYNRKNLGDDSYMYAMNCIFGVNLDFYCMDDISEIPLNTSTIICGGGDIINDYFMKKAEKLLANFVGRVYGVSIGIPYESCAKYLLLFDHVFMRSKKDYDIAVSVLGRKNVDLCPDISWILASMVHSNPKKVMNSHF